VWRGVDSRESQGDVKQTVNIDGLFVGSSTINSYSLPSKYNYPFLSIIPNSGIIMFFCNNSSEITFLNEDKNEKCFIHFPDFLYWSHLPFLFQEG
jgi:hypothetical protein